MKNTIIEKDKKIEKLNNEVDRLKKHINNNSDNSSLPSSYSIKSNKKIYITILKNQTRNFLNIMAIRVAIYQKRCKIKIYSINTK